MIENLDCVFIVRNLELFKKKAIKNGEAKDLLTGDLYGYDKKKRLIQVWGSHASPQHEYFQWVVIYPKKSSFAKYPPYNWPYLIKFAERDHLVDYKFLLEVYKEKAIKIENYPKHFKLWEIFKDN